MIYNLTGNMQTQQMGGGLRVEMPSGGGGPVHWDDIEGRPFYSEGVQEVELLPETILADPTESGFTILTIIDDITAGDIYTVNYNGASYDCVAQDASSVMAPGVILLGNGSDFGLVGNDEPFTLVIFLGGMEGLGGMLVPLDGTTEGTLSITYKTEVIHKLDPKYLDLSKLPVGGGAKVYYVNANETGETMYIYLDKECTTKETLEGLTLTVESLQPIIVATMMYGHIVSTVQSVFVNITAGSYGIITTALDSQKYQFHTVERETV